METGFGILLVAQESGDLQHRRSMTKENKKGNKWEKGGCVTFVSSNKVKPPQDTYLQSSDVIPLLKKLKFTEKYCSTFGQVDIQQSALLSASTHGRNVKLKTGSSKFRSDSCHEFCPFRRRANSNRATRQLDFSWHQHTLALVFHMCKVHLWERFKLYLNQMDG